ncbi:hypothetical protein RYX36_002622, partial [Vicia faba]
IYFKMFTYSESTLHFDSDSEEVEFTSVNGDDGRERDTLEKDDCNGHKCLIEITDEDIRAMEFSIEEEAIQFYVTYVHFHGFAVDEGSRLKIALQRILV